METGKDTGVSPTIEPEDEHEIEEHEYHQSDQIGLFAGLPDLGGWILGKQLMKDHDSDQPGEIFFKDMKKKSHGPSNKPIF